MDAAEYTSVTPLVLRVTKPRPLDWRFPDAYGFSERTLSPLQLAVHEVLKWRGDPPPLLRALQAFDCIGEGLRLHRPAEEPILGCTLAIWNPAEEQTLREAVEAVFAREGYVLLGYPTGVPAFWADMGPAVPSPACASPADANRAAPPLANVSQADAIPRNASPAAAGLNAASAAGASPGAAEHWALLVDCSGEGVTLAAENGASVFFRGSVGRVPWDVFQAGGPAAEVRLAIVQPKRSVENAEPEVWFRSLLRGSAERMQNGGGLRRLEQFIGTVEALPSDQLYAALPGLELDLNRYRRLPELWQLAVEKQAVPASLMSAAWVEELFYVCKCWTLILGVVGTWKRQPERSGQSKLVDYLKQTWHNEARLVAELARAAGG